MKKPITKSQIRIDINLQIAEFLSRGGDVEQIARGISGRNLGDPPIKPSREFFTQPKETRTYIPEVLAAMDERKRMLSSKRKSSPPPQRKPQKKLIYDDFGEPLRWEWIDE